MHTTRQVLHPLRLLRATIYLSACAVLCGCPALPKAEQLAAVAKDWCLTIRASQVIPVYPLTRDLWPGDVFLTTTPIGKEVDLFEAKGFLPLDIHMKRLATNGTLKTFYADRLGDGAAFPGTVAQWTGLPASAFPTYSFAISRSGGLDLAIPIQGIPVGFDVLHTSAATGTVTLKQTCTVGLDVASLQPLLAAWEKDNRGVLAAYATDPSDAKQHPVFVRVVARIYQAKSVAVSLADAAGTGAELAGGVELPKPEAGTPDANKSVTELYSDLSSKVNASLQTKLGGKVRFVSASKHSVSLEEDFAEPMTIGYVAYDCQILPGGVLSMPVPTLQRLAGSSVPNWAVLNSASLVEAWYTADEAPRKNLIQEWMRQNPPKEQTAPSAVEFLAAPKWDAERRRMIRDLRMIPH